MGSPNTEPELGSVPQDPTFTTPDNADTSSPTPAPAPADPEETDTPVEPTAESAEAVEPELGSTTDPAAE